MVKEKIQKTIVKFFSCTIMFDALCKYSFGDAVGKKGKEGIRLI
jgi:predicted metal-binding protein